MKRCLAILPGAPICEYVGVLRTGAKGRVWYAYAITSYWERFRGTTGTGVLHQCWLRWKFHKVHKPQLQPLPLRPVCPNQLPRRQARKGEAFCCWHYTSTSGELIYVASQQFLPVKLYNFSWVLTGIRTLPELCYDYGYVLKNFVSADVEIVKLPCYCGAPDCQKRLY